MCIMFYDSQMSKKTVNWVECGGRREVETLVHPQLTDERGILLDSTFNDFINNEL